ncbi:MAG: DUF362 domain-containing protein [bacterium]
MKSQVYFASAKVIKGKGLLERLKIILNKLGLSGIINEGEAVAVKLHMGEAGQTRYIRPVFARQVVEEVKKAGGRPFVTDTTTLYRHKRGNLFDYLETAAYHGFTAETMGCPIIIADGLKNTGVEIEVASPLRLSRIKVAQYIYEADGLISLAHVTFHPFVAPAASIKNIGMGCATRESKLAMHTSEAKPEFKAQKCTACRICLRICPGEAFSWEDDEIHFDPTRCVGCGDCIVECKGGALTVPWQSQAAYQVQRGTIDAYKAVVSTFNPGKVLFINLALDITELCDCINYADIPVIPDIGLLAGTDPLAVDKAGYDLILKSAGYPGSKLADRSPQEEPAEKLTEGINVARFFDMAKEAGVGQIEYELIEV